MRREPDTRENLRLDPKFVREFRFTAADIVRLANRYMQTAVGDDQRREIRLWGEDSLRRLRDAKKR